MDCGGWRTSQPRTFQPWIFEPWGWNVHGWKSGVEKSGVEMSFNLLERWHLNPIFFNHDLFNSMVQKFMVERSGVEAWGWKVRGWDVLQPFKSTQTTFKNIADSMNSGGFRIILYSTFHPTHCSLLSRVQLTIQSHICSSFQFQISVTKNVIWSSQIRGKISEISYAFDLSLRLYM